MGKLPRTVRKLVRAAVWRTPLREYIGTRWQYNMEPAQLAYLCDCLDRTKDIPGCVVEAGCAAGHTTLYLHRHMSYINSRKDYYAIDTFEGFTQVDIAFELEQRGKTASDFEWSWAGNEQGYFDQGMRRAGADEVTSIRADVGQFDFSTIAPIAFCLLDVDLFRPTAKALPGIWAALSPGGICVVDDVMGCANRYDGACQAYLEFTGSVGLEPTLLHYKFGVLVK